jgi:hypothetical protein
MIQNIRFFTFRKTAAVMALATAATLIAPLAQAHMGIVNLTTGIRVGGQSQFAIAGTTNELQFSVPHGCNTSHGFSGNFDTFKFTVTVPAPLVSSALRATPIPQFGVPARVTNGDGSVTFTWEKSKSDISPLDNLLYRPVLRVAVPAASGNSITKYQFLSVQYCMDGGQEKAMDWGATDSPRLIVFPVKRAGFNSYTLDSQTVGDFTVTGTNTIESRLKSYFGDAAVIWVGKDGYSPNVETQKKIGDLIGKDPSYGTLPRPGRSLATTDTIWVRY